MASYLALVNSLRSEFESYEVSQVPRESYSHTDALANLGSSIDSNLKRDHSRWILREAMHRSNGQLIDRSSRWLVSQFSRWLPIIRYIKESKFPSDKQEARKLWIRSARYVIINDNLYRRSHSGPYLRCLDSDQALYIIKEIHEGYCGNHSGRR